MLILSPTRELASQTEKTILALGDYMSIQVHGCIGGKSMGEDIRKLEYGVHVVSGTPEPETNATTTTPLLPLSNLEIMKAHEIESDEDDYLTGFTTEMARSLLHQENPKTRVMAGLPKSTLCGLGSWAGSS
ncbi:hypothetical protein IFM89_031952 [Coptis chinensis]|uniref:DEAD/DEAH-box helicase domain-containing protein n=1 Tax=Coptis chinensis TaxID=261450 RepID=A0A835J1M4_9MAGN|nr:hypothetical protein IFM89_031952 [Coptis chinensis]